MARMKVQMHLIRFRASREHITDHLPLAQTREFDLESMEHPDSIPGHLINPCNLPLFFRMK